MVEEAILHKQCNTIFFCGSSFNTDGKGSRKQDDFRLELFDELCTWLETELEHSLFTLEQIHQNMSPWVHLLTSHLCIQKYTYEIC